jgi:tRNA A-37 threonylcarbamoyl transferase component Bud32
MALTPCPSRDELHAFSDGALTPVRDEAVLQHLDLCPVCQQALESLPAAPDSWAAALARPVAADPYQEETACQAAVTQFEAALPEARTASAALPRGVVGHYELLAHLGEGGMGAVYRARHQFLKQEVALKLLPADRLHDESARARFRREMEAVGRLRHAHLVAARDAGVSDGQPYLVLELLDGLDLGKLVQAHGPLPVADACEAARQAALGLHHAHAHGLVHRDVKPSNLWLTPDGQVKVLDLGLARFVSEPAEGRDELTAAGQVVGTVDYLAPEAVDRGSAVDARADQYSLGCTLYRLLTGVVPFAGPEFHTPLQRALAHTRRPVPPVRERRPEVPEELAAVVERLLAKDPAQRYDSAAAVAEALQPFATGADLAGLLARVLSARGGTTGVAAAGATSSSLGGRPESTVTNAPAAAQPAVAVGVPARREQTIDSAAPTVDWPGARPVGTPRQGRSNRVRLAVAGTLGLLLVLGTLGYAFVRNRPRDATTNPSTERREPAERLRVRALEVQHFVNVDEKRTGPQRLLGTDSFGAVLNDDIKVVARLSQPAYAYVIVFRPDGTDEVLYPQGAAEVPERTDMPRYPSRDRTKVYGLTEGTGLWLVALVASERPLPAYSAWRAQHATGPWTKSDGEANVVWLDDGQWLEAVTPRGVRHRGGRGEKEAAGTAPIVRVVDWLKAETGGVVSAVGFTVEAKR